MPFTFPTDPAVANSLVNIGDINAVGGVANASNWTQGGTLLTQLPQPPEGAHDWFVSAVSFSAYMGLTINQTIQAFGKFGKILAGIVSGDESVAASGNPLYAGVHPVSQLPPDPTLIGALWDPAVDPLPPITTAISYLSINTGVTPVTVTIQPPTPLQIVGEGLPPKIGIWVLPSLLSMDASNHTPIRYIMAAKATIYYQTESK